MKKDDKTKPAKITEWLTILASICTITGMSFMSIISIIKERPSLEKFNDSISLPNTYLVSYISSSIIETYKFLINPINVENAVRYIKNTYNRFQNQKNNMKIFSDNSQIRIYYTSSEIESIEVLGDFSNTSYSRIYFFDKDILYFSFIFKGGEKENRLYFYNDTLIRYKDEDGITHDLYKNLESCEWKNFSLEESYELLNNYKSIIF